jgi:acyl-CoA synthetase (AMP-forming)/AMP-acid ligase II
LRFVRSSSAALPGSVLEGLQALFAVPVVEAYGMTEASHQMTCNPLPPAATKPGSVGIPTGIEVAILDAQNNLLPTGERGEVAIKGRTIVDGYENNPTANEAAFTAGWFRTGDEGMLDEEGYLFLTGRLKEQINRGGEKISPIEVDEVLLRHPAVAEALTFAIPHDKLGEEGYLFLTGRLKEQINRGGEKISPIEVDEVLLRHPAVAEALTFAIPHDKLGEEVGAAVVLREGHDISERALRADLSDQLAAFKVPKRIIFVKEIPKGATGKPQRIGLAAKLDL